MATYILYNDLDRVAMQILLEKHPDYIPYQVTGSIITEPEPIEIAENNLILIGGDAANAYSKKYFFDTGIITYDLETEQCFGPGVYANGRQCITSITRENGTTVTLLMGWTAIETLYTVEDFVNRETLLLAALGPAIAAGVTLGIALAT